MKPWGRPGGRDGVSEAPINPTLFGENSARARSGWDFVVVLEAIGKSSLCIVTLASAGRCLKARENMTEPRAAGKRPGCHYHVDGEEPPSSSTKWLEDVDRDDLVSSIPTWIHLYSVLH